MSDRPRICRLPNSLRMLPDIDVDSVVCKNRTKHSQPSSVKEYIRENCTKMSNGCWEWKKSLNSRGYGMAFCNGRQITAHRLSFMVFNGKTNGKLVCHSCDNKACVNPNHLFSGTEADNLNDAYRKNRRGKLSKATLIEVRSLISQGRSLRSIAKLFNVTHSALTWRKSKGIL